MERWREHKIEIQHRSSPEVIQRHSKDYPQTLKGGMSKTGFSAEIVWANHDRPPVVVFLPESTVGTNFCKGVSGCSVGMS